MINFIINIFRYIIAIPLEIIRYPLIFCLKISLFFFASGALILTAFGYGYTNPILYEKAIVFSAISAASGAGIPLYFFILKLISPFYGWLERRQERKYYDKEYRLDLYKNNRRFNETGFDKMASEQDIYYMIKQIHLSLKTINFLI